MYAQKSQLSGTVSDAENTPLVGASIIVEGTHVGTTTDADGAFRLPAAPGQRLTVSYLGYKSKTVTVGSRTSLDIILESDNSLINEVVVVGYDTQKKVNLTGSVASVSAEDLANRPIVSSSTALQGIAPGVTVTTQSGAPGGDGWKGAESGKEAQESDNSGVSLLNKANLGDYASPYSHMKYDEVLFIFAEAIKRGWIDGGDALAEQYYNDAVRASIRFWSDVNKTGNPVSESTVERFLANIPYDGTLESILDQKYVALFWTGFEAWHEYRRTGYPALVIGEGTQNDHVLPTRMAYPTIAIKTNPDNYAAEVARLQSVFRGADDMKTPVWWSAEAVRKGIE